MKRYGFDYDRVDGPFVCMENGSLVEYEDAQSTITALQAQLAERDKIILEQQTRIRDLDSGIYKMANTPADNFIHDAAWAHNLYSEARRLYELRSSNLSALEAHDREVRIKCLEDAAEKICGNGFNTLHELPLRDGSYRMAAEELNFMANELKEQS